MTEEVTGGVEAPAETPDVAETTEVVEAEHSPRGAIDRAFESLEQGEPAEETAKAERPRNPDGTFAAKAAEEASETPKEAKDDAKAAETATKQQAPLSEAPSRFSADAKAAWATTPDSVRGEVHRALREAEQGIEKYKGNATRYEQVWKPFEDLAVQSQMDPVATLKGYVQIDQLLAQDFNKGLEAIFQRAGQDPKAWAARLNGETPAEPSAQDRVIGELRQQVTELQRELQGIGGTVRDTQQANIGQALSQFQQSLPEADQKLFLELDAEIAAELQEPSVTLAQAFENAKQKATERYSRLFGQPQTQPAPSPAAAQTRDPTKGKLSVTGAPGAGSDPAVRKTPTSPRVALDRAFAEFGL